MTPSSVTARVTAETCALVAALAAPAGWLGGPTGALGVLAGGVLAVVNFRWLAARAVAVASGSGVAGGMWLVGAGLRLAAFAAVCAGLLALEWAHPVALLAGLSVLPCAVIVEGLRAGRGER
jgi:ATP synthase I chain